MASRTVRLIGRLIGLAIVVGAVAALALVVDLNYRYPRTDDAYVRANVIGIAPHVQGPLIELHVVDNQLVNVGDLLFVIDPRPYQAELDRAKGELLVVQADVDGIRRSIDAGKAEVSRLQADSAYVNAHVKRLEPLLPNKYVSPDQFQEATSRAQALTAGVRRAQQEVERQQRLLAQYGDFNARLEKAKAQVYAAELNVGYCYVRAPFKARVTNLNTAVGDYARVGQQVFALLDDRIWYVLANFRETFLEHIEPGMQADVTLVGYPNRTFREVVQGLAWGVLSQSGEQVGVLPKVEPTLNWARLAQRIPVRIILGPGDPGIPYRMGMTAVVTIRGFPASGPLTVPGMPGATPP